MDVTLERSLDLECYKIQAEMQIMERTDYMLAVLAYAGENGGAATPESLSMDLLAGYETMAKRLLERCAGEGLLEAGEGEYILTDRGREAIRLGRTPVSYGGIWIVHVTSDPLVPEGYRMLGIERGEDLEWKDNKPVPDQPEPEELPSAITDLRGDLLQPSFGKVANPVRIKKIEVLGKKLEPDLKVRAIWRMDGEKSSLVLKASVSMDSAPLEEAFGLLELPREATIAEVNRREREMVLGHRPSGSHIPRIKKVEEAAELIRANYDAIRGVHRLGLASERQVDAPDVKHDEVWGLIAKGTGRKWDPENCRMLASYNSVKPAELLAMKADPNARITLKGLEKFDAAAKDVPLFPASAKDAKKWAADVLLHMMGQEYVTRERYEETVARIQGMFPGFEIDLGDRMSHVPQKRTPLFWHIRAMEDWDL